MATRIDYQNIYDKETIGEMLYSSKYTDGFFQIKTLEDLKNETRTLMNSTDDQDLKAGLEIILILISHEKKDVIAYSLGKLYTMIHDAKTRNMILHELNQMKKNDEANLRNSIEKSMDVITGEVDSYKVFDLSVDIFDHLISNLSCNTKKLLEMIHLDVTGMSRKSFKLESSIKTFTKSLVTNKTLMLHWNDMMYSVMKLLVDIDEDMNVLGLEGDDLDDYYLKNLEGPEILPYNELKEIEITNETHLHTLADVYATTFREKGHINHLLNYLDDDDYKIRRMGVLALIYVLKKLTGFEEKSPCENLISHIFKHNRAEFISWKRDQKLQIKFVK